MTLSLQNLRDGLLKATATELDDWDNGNVDLDLYINKSWWDIMDQFDFREKEGGPIVFPTISGIRSYDISSITSPIIFDALQRLSITDIDDFSHLDLDLITDFDYENLYIADASLNSKPTNYFRRGSLIYLYPTPDQVYSINLYYLQVLSDLPVQGPVIPQAWGEIIQYGANYRALYDLRDYESAEKVIALQTKLINGRTPVKVKELSDTKTSGVSVLGRDY